MKLFLLTILFLPLVCFALPVKDDNFTIPYIKNTAYNDTIEISGKRDSAELNAEILIYENQGYKIIKRKCYNHRFYEGEFKSYVALYCEITMGRKLNNVK